MNRQPVRQNGVRRRKLVGAGCRTAGRLQMAEGPIEAFPDAAAQFRRCRFGVSDHQHLAQAEPLFSHQAQHQMGESKGFAGACTGLQQLQARLQREAVGLEQGRQGRWGHGFHQQLASSSGP